MWTLKIVILTPSRHPKSIKFEELMSVQQLCCSVVGRYQQVQTLFASELQLSTRFPFHCQDRFIFWFKWGSENEVEKSVEKVVPKGPQMDPKSRPKSIERVFWRGLKKEPQKWTVSRTRKSEILLLYTALQQSRKFQKRHMFGSHFRGPFGRQNC